MNRRNMILATAGALFVADRAWAQTSIMNFPERRAHIINNSPLLELSGFSYENTLGRSDYRMLMSLAWRNIGDQPITAFEVVLAYFDPFNRRMPIGGVWMIPGKNSANWTPLNPGERSNDGLNGVRAERVMTAFVYVREVLQANRSVWTFQPSAVEREIRRLMPAIRDIGNLDPEPTSR